LLDGGNNAIAKRETMPSWIKGNNAIVMRATTPAQQQRGNAIVMRAKIAIAMMAKMPVHQPQQRHHNKGNNASLTRSDKGNDASLTMAETPAH
jgi:hypothetical protein